MGVTIKDVARKTGLSITTVSLVLNKKQSRIPEKTRQIVESAAQELNYSPNHAAQSLATKRTGMLALVLPETNYYAPSDVLIPTEHAASIAGLTLVLKLVEDDDESCLEALAGLMQRGVDGIVFDPSTLGAQSVARYMELIDAADMPVVSLGSVGAHILPNAVVPDHRRGGYLAAAHLLELGHARIGCLVGPDDAPVFRDFATGYRDALEEKGLGATSDLVAAVPAGVQEERSVDGAARLVEEGATGIVAGSLALAHSVYRYAYQHDLAIGRDLSVIAYGDYGQAAGLVIAPTTVSVHFDRLARKAVGLLKRLSKKATPVTPEILAPSLVVRESTAAPVR